MKTILINLVLLVGIFQPQSFEMRLSQTDDMYFDQNDTELVTYAIWFDEYKEISITTTSPDGEITYIYEIVSFQSNQEYLFSVYEGDVLSIYEADIRGFEDLIYEEVVQRQ